MGQRSIFVAGVLVAASWAAWLGQEFIFQWLEIPWKSELLGQLGDTFGALNALFSALAFIGVLLTLQHQRDDLACQQKQIFDAKQEEHRQSFDNSFFQLLALLRDVKKEVSFNRPGRGTALGHDALYGAAEELMRYLTPSFVYESEINREKERKFLAGLYTDGVHSTAEDTLGPYFRIVYTILRRISENELLDGPLKARYGNLIRSQLSSPEISLIAANGLTEASNNFVEFITEFRLLKYLPKGGYRTMLERIYPAQAFQARD